MIATARTLAPDVFGIFIAGAVIGWWMRSTLAARDRRDANERARMRRALRERT